MNEQEYDPRVWYLWLNIQKKKKEKKKEKEKVSLQLAPSANPERDLMTPIQASQQWVFTLCWRLTRQTKKKKRRRKL